MALKKPRRIGSKLALAGILLLSPFVFLAAMFFGHWYGELRLSISTRDGLEYVRALREFFEPLERHRVATLRVLAGEPGRISPREIGAEVNAGLAQVAQADRQYGATLGFGTAVRELAIRWQRLDAGWNHLGLNDLTGEYDALISATLALHERVEAAANFPLDPRAESYYLLDAIGPHLLDAADLAGDFESKFLATLPVQVAGLSARDRLVVGLDRLTGVLQSIDTDVTRTLELNDARSQPIGPAYQEFRLRLDALMAVARNAAAAPAITLSREEVERVAAPALEAAMAFHETARAAVVAIMNDRIHSQTRAITLTLAAAIVLALVAVGFAAQLGARIVSQLASARRACRRIESGDFEAPLEMGSNDEIGDVIEALGRMQRVLKERTELDRVLAAVAEYTSSAVTVCDEHGAIEWANGGFERMTGYSRAAARGKTAEDLLGREATNPDACARIAEARRSHQGWSEEILSRGAGGREFIALVEGQPVIVGNGISRGFVCIESDVTELRRLERQSLTARDDVLRQLGQEIHDGLGQELTALTMFASALSTQVARHQTPSTEDLNRIVEIGRHALVTCRQVARGLSPLSASGGDLIEGLKGLAHHSTISGSLDVALVVSHEPVPLALDANTRDQLFRIVQEAVSNAIKHARASIIEIQVSATPEFLSIAVEDDGRGLPERFESGRGLGIRTMRYRAALIGARLSIGPGPKRGTAVRCLCPQLKAEPHGGTRQVSGVRRVANAEKPN